MPKKFKGENSKAVEARARKEAQRQEEKTKKEKEAEDAYWADDDKHVQKKQQRKEEKEKKRIEQMEKKKELQKLHDEEMEQIKGKPERTEKLTRAKIEARLEQERLQAEAARKKEEEKVHHEVALEENVNRLEVDGDEARTVEEAISVLKVQEPELDKHPEKRMKAAYQKYEDENLPRLKQENPNLRLSQLKQMLKKDWMKSPENPLNQVTKAYNAK